MGETTGEIESHIEGTREDLRAHLKELWHKVKSVTDWRQQLQSHPKTMIAVAFGGGLLIAMIMRKGKRH